MRISTLVRCGVLGVVLAAASCSLFLKSDDEVLAGKKCPCANDEGYGCNSDGVCVRCTAAQTVCSDRCVDLQTNPNNCGACGKVCSVTNGSPGCAGGQCIISVCNVSSGDCNGDAVDGCEANVSKSTVQCGSCLNDCTAPGRHCDNGHCACACPMDMYPCSSSSSLCGTGQCINSETSAACRCVMRPLPCNYGEGCSDASSCSCNGGPACDAGYLCCGATLGCRDPRGDPESCGNCGHTCPKGFICSMNGCECTKDQDCDTDDGLDAVSCTAGKCVCGDAGPCANGVRCRGNVCG